MAQKLVRVCEGLGLQLVEEAAGLRVGDAVAQAVPLDHLEPGRERE